MHPTFTKALYVTISARFLGERRKVPAALVGGGVELVVVGGGGHVSSGRPTTGSQDDECSNLRTTVS